VGQYTPFDSTIESFTNNFYTHFPCRTDKRFPEGMKRQLRRLSGWDKTGKEEIEDMRSEISEKDILCFLARPSDKFLNQTAEEFYRELDTTALELGMIPEVLESKIEALHRAVEIHTSLGKEESLRLTLDINDYLLPLYKILRSRGYNKPELWG